MAANSFPRPVAGGPYRLDDYCEKRRSIHAHDQMGFLNTWQSAAAQEGAAERPGARKPPAYLGRFARNANLAALGRLLQTAKQQLSGGKMELEEPPAEGAMLQFKQLGAEQLLAALEGSAGGSAVEACLLSADPAELFRCWSSTLAQASMS